MKGKAAIIAITITVLAITATFLVASTFTNNGSLTVAEELQPFRGVNDGSHRPRG